MNLFSIDSVWHVGNLDKMKKSSFSLEGDLLSVSLTPKTWSKLARANGVNHKLELKGALYVDFYDFLEHNLDDIIRWANDKGYINKEKVYSFTYYDDEIDEELTFSFDTVDALVSEFPDASDDEIHIDESYVLSETYIAQNKSSSKSKYDITNVQIEFIEDHVVADNEQIVGIWWNDAFRPESFSAPRGGIFNSRLHLFNISKEASLFDVDIEELYNIPTENLQSGLRR